MGLVAWVIGCLSDSIGGFFSSDLLGAWGWHIGRMVFIIVVEEMPSLNCP